MTHDTSTSNCVQRNSLLFENEYECNHGDYDRYHLKGRSPAHVEYIEENSTNEHDDEFDQTKNMQTKRRHKKLPRHKARSWCDMFGVLVLMMCCGSLRSSIMVAANLHEPTLVGIGQCEPIPQIKLPLYWSSKYSFDGQDHHGPADLTTIIGTPPYGTIPTKGGPTDQNDNHEQVITTDSNVSPSSNEQIAVEEVKQQPTKGTKGNNNAQVSPPNNNKKNNNNNNQGGAPKNNNQKGQKQNKQGKNNNANNGKGKGRHLSQTSLKNVNDIDNNNMEGTTTTSRSLQQVGTMAGDGTTRASFEDVANGARVIVVVFYYADLRQCSLLGTDLSALVDEVNAELLASVMEEPPSMMNEDGSVNEVAMDQEGRRRNAAEEDNGTHEEEVLEEESQVEAEPESVPPIAPPVAAVILNNMWPITCDQYDTKCEADNEELQPHQWQDKIMTAAPKLPMLQDTYKVNAWDTIFGTYYTDVLVYVDGHLYQYYPSALALSHSDVLKENVDHSEGFILNNWPKFKQDLINAANVPFEWCKDGQVAYPEPQAPSTQLQYVGNGGVPFYDQLPMGLQQQEKAETTSEDYFDFVLGFMFAGIAVGTTLLLCVIWKCCLKCMEYWCIDIPIHRVRRMKMEHDGLGEFRPLTASTEDDDDDYFDDDLSEFYRHQNDVDINEDDEDSWSDEEDEYSHYHRILRDEQREKEQQQKEGGGDGNSKKNNPFLFKLPKMMMKKNNNNNSPPKPKSKKKKRPHNRRHYQDDADVDSEYGMATGDGGHHGSGFDGNNEFGDDKKDLFLSIADEETAALERLRNPQKVAEDFFRRQEEVELEMRVFREEAQREQEEMKKRKEEEEEQERRRRLEDEKKKKKKQDTAMMDDDAVSVRSTASSVKEHLASLMADDDEEDTKGVTTATTDANLLGTEEGDGDAFDGAEFKEAITAPNGASSGGLASHVSLLPPRGENPNVDIEENNFSGRYGGNNNNDDSNGDKEEQEGEEEESSPSSQSNQEGDLLGIASGGENNTGTTVTAAATSKSISSSQEKTEPQLIDPLDEEVDDNIDDIEGDDEEEEDDDDNENDNEDEEEDYDDEEDDDDESLESALDLELLQQTVAKSIESEKKTKAS